MSSGDTTASSLQQCTKISLPVDALLPDDYEQSTDEATGQVLVYPKGLQQLTAKEYVPT